MEKTFNIGITAGDASGIGQEIIAKAISHLTPDIRRRIKIYGSARTMERYLDEFCSSAGDITIIDVSKDADDASLALNAVDDAARDALSHRISAIVTAPVNKARMQTASKGFCGHTEYLAKVSGALDTTMCFIGSLPNGFCLAMSVVNTHVPLRDVAGLLTTDKICRTIKRTEECIQKIKGRRPRIAVMALNPHAGEDSLLGGEEKEIILPAIQRMKEAGIHCDGPWPSDGLMYKLKADEYDACIAMHHDQGTMPMKLLCGMKLVNVTLGLPYVRTSPAHGTAEDIAGYRIADETSMLYAIELADELIRI
jgi:4-hydroxythreonine-4-phosphate dehydrogenase